jgi:cytochrome c peroxidase
MRAARKQRRFAIGVACAALLLAVASCRSTREAALPAWEVENPIRPPAPAPVGMEFYFADVKTPPNPASVRLGRWLFYDTRLSGDNTVSCATCHRPEHAFSEPTPVSTGIRGQKGTRKAPTFINQAVTLQPHFFWDGRAESLEDQALGPIANPIEMGSNHVSMIETLSRVHGYKPYFEEVFGSDEITKDRVAKAIADYERTRVSGNAPYDRWRAKRDQRAVSDQAKLGHDLFFDKAGCSSCHLGSNFTDSAFHNLGIGWDPKTQTFADEGRFVVTKNPADRGAFKTPTLREVTKRAPYMHDGSIATLREVVELYSTGAVDNPWLDQRMKAQRQDPQVRRQRLLTDAEIDALVAFLESLEGEGYQDTPPKHFPQ